MEHLERWRARPSRDADGQPETPEQHPAVSCGTSVQTILIAENEATNRHLMEQILRFAGYECLVASNGREALAILDTQHVDLVLVDISMPVLNGFETLASIRERPGGRALPVVAVTAHALSEDRQRALHSGFSDYLTKPFRPRDLLRVVAEQLGQG